MTLANYIERTEPWTAATTGIWEEKDLGTSPFNVPSGAIAEIVLRNLSPTQAYSAGVRPSGSSIDRRLDICDNNGGFTEQFMTMHVPLESGTIIETYIENGLIQFELAGYWTKGTYIATSGQFTVSSFPPWPDKNLDSFGVQNDDIAEIVIGNNASAVPRTGGIRESGSKITRSIGLDRAVAGMYNSVTMMVRATGVNAMIEAFSSSTTNVDFNVVGYWRQNPLTFVEKLLDLGDGVSSGVWENRDLSGSGIAPKSVVEATLLNQDVSAVSMGIRASGSALSRDLLITESNAVGVAQPLTMHAQTINSEIETYISDPANDHQFLLLGFWEPTPINDSIVLFVGGHDLLSSSISLTALGADVHSSGLDLFLSSNDTLLSSINLMTLGADIHSSGLDLFLSGDGTSSSGVDLFLKGTTNPYVEMIQEWSPVASSVWETRDLSGAPFYVPPSAVLEIAISNSTTGAADPAYSGGVRAVGSTFNREIDIHPAEQGGKNFAVMHVQANAASEIETFAEHLTFNQFTLLGYWTQGQYVEVTGTLNVTASATWQGRDLTSFGVPAGAVTEILLSNTNVSAQRSIGVRASGSTLDRRFNIHEAEDAGVDSLTLFTNATSGSANIEIYGQGTTNIDFVLLGYWSTPPLAEFIETVVDIGEAVSDTTWESQDLSTLLPLDINPFSVLEVVVGNDEGGAERELGIRQSGSTQNRLLDLHEAEGDGLDYTRMHVNLDGNKTVEIYEESAASVSDFIVAGYWQDGPAPAASLNLFMQGRRAFPQLRSQKIYFTNQDGSIDRADLDGSNWESMIDSSHALAPSGPLGMAIDALGGHVYWTETGRDLIVRMGLEVPNGETALNRSDVEILMSGVAGIGAPQDLDIHVVSGLMIFSTLSPNVLVSGYMDIPGGETFSNRTDLAQLGTAITVSKVIIDEIEDRYYVAETVFDTIQRATLADATRETIFDATGGFVFGGLGQDTVLGDIYFVDTVSDDIQKLAQDGSESAEVVFDSPSGELSTSRGMFVDITEDERKIYLSDSLDFVARINLDGTGFEKIAENFVAPDFKTLTNPNELEVYQIPFINSEISLFVAGPEQIESDASLFTIGPILASSGVNLFTAGPIQATSGLDLFMIGPVQATGVMTLAGLRPSGSIGELDLYVAKKDLASGTITLFMTTPSPISGDMSLYIANSGVQVSFIGFMKGAASDSTDDIPLFVRGTSDADPIFFKDASMELYLKTIGDTTDSPSVLDTSIFLRVASGYLDINTNWGLFLKSSTLFNTSLDVSITGTSGGTLASGNMALYIQSFVDKANWLIFLKTVSGTQNSMTLLTSGMPAGPILASSTLLVPGMATQTGEIDLFLFNEPPSSSGSMTMFLATTPLIGSGLSELYIHGF